MLKLSTLSKEVANLKNENGELKQKNEELELKVLANEELAICAMIATTELFEMALAMSEQEVALKAEKNKGGSTMVEVYVTLILKGKKTLEQVPAVIRPQVEAMLQDLGAIE